METNETYRLSFSDGAIEISCRGEGGELEVNFFGLESLDQYNMERLITVFKKLSEDAV